MSLPKLTTCKFCYRVCSSLSIQQQKFLVSTTLLHFATYDYLLALKLSFVNESSAANVIELSFSLGFLCLVFFILLPPLLYSVRHCGTLLLVHY
ncbi:hypothetical protein AHF37_08840 [Paragonimus kellicotti]|nr:hypothetical protein AHF37_08840 [Paragonimus kellicotti]